MVFPSMSWGVSLWSGSHSKSANAQILRASGFPFDPSRKEEKQKQSVETMITYRSPLCFSALILWRLFLLFLFFLFFWASKRKEKGWDKNLVII